MTPITKGALTAVAALSLLAGCGSDAKLTVPTNAGTTEATLPTGLTVPPGVTVPTGLTIPAGVSLPTGFTVPEATIDLMITQLAAAGMKVDKDCFKQLLKDDALLKLIETPGTPSAELIQKFSSCLST